MQSVRSMLTGVSLDGRALAADDIRCAPSSRLVIPMMRSRLVTLLLGIAVFAGVLYLGWIVAAQWRGPALLEAQPVPPGDREVAWIHLATSGSTWERFVEGAHHAQAVLRQVQPLVDLQVDESNAFPQSSASVPELVMAIAGQPGKIRVRYYKLTSETNAGYWVRELANREPAPAAIIGGMSTDQARDLARALRDQPDWHGPQPVFIIATATADRVAVRGGSANVLPSAEQDTEDLMDIYPNRSFRFCFTNSQMAQAVTRFIWSRDKLKPDAGPVYLVSWKDDPYSQDLTKQFYDCLWADPMSNERAKLPRSPVVEAPGPPSRWLIPYSVGSHSRPNDREAEIAERLLDELSRQERQQQALLVLPAASQPARRFIRAMVQTAPTMVDRFTVATGDYIDFNSVCRDRNLSWPIQALPLRLVFFSHRNPVDVEAGFVAGPEARSSSTDDKLLYADMAEALTRTMLMGGSTPEVRDPRAAFAALVGRAAQPRFDARGNLRAGTGEFVTLLQPQRNEIGRVLPSALLSVFRRVTPGDRWELMQSLQLGYTGHETVGRSP